MKKRWKRFITAIVTAAMVVGAVPSAAMAAGENNGPEAKTEDRLMFQLSGENAEETKTTAPTFKIDEKTVDGEVKFTTEVTLKIEVENAEEGTVIYYTSDGTEPTEESTKYENGITITETMTIKAIAVKGDIKSDVSEITLTKESEEPGESVDAPTFKVEGEVVTGNVKFATGATLEIEAEKDAVIYYTSDGTEPTEQSTKYESEIEVTETTTIKAVAVKGEAKSDVSEITLTKKSETPEPEKSIVLEASDTVIYHNISANTATIKASVKNTEGAVTWTSSDEKVATVTASEDGLTATVTGLSTGSVTVTAAVDGVSASCEFNVKSKSSSGGGGSPSGGGSSNKDDSSNETSSDVSVNESGKAEFTAENVLELADSGENLTVSNKGVQAVVPNGILSGNSDEKLEITLTKVSEGTVKAAQEAAKNYGVAEVIGGAESSAAIEIKAGENVILSYSTPVEITVDVDKTAVESKNVNLLTLAKVNGDGSLTYIGGNYSDGEFTAKANEGGEYVLVYKEDIKKINLQIGSEITRLNGAEVYNDVAPIIMGDRTMVPIRYIVETFGGEVLWDDADKVITMIIDGKTMTMQIGTEIEGMGVAPEIVGDRTVVPVRYVAEQLGANVIWDQATQEIDIIR